MSRLYLAFVLTAAASAAPILGDLAPRGGQVGATVKLTLKGSHLDPGATLQTTLPGRVSRLQPRTDLEKPGTELPFLVEINKDAAPGLYPVRAVTPDGISNVMLFAVGNLPEQQEEESEDVKRTNGEAAKAQAFSIPGVMNGTLGAADLDFYSFTAKAGERIVFEIEANVVASAIDPAFEIYDSAGNLVAKNDDAAGIDSRLEHTFTKAGTYRVRVHDSKYSAQEANFYRLKAGTYSYATSLFPLGWKRGETPRVQALGGNLAQPLDVKPEPIAGKDLSLVRIPNSQSLPLLFAWSDDPHVLEGSSSALVPGTVVNGRLLKAKEVDRYTLAVKPGEHWMFETTASRYGTSPLDALITIRDASGKKLASRDDLAGADPALPFEVPEKVTELHIEIEDVLGRGGAEYGYQLVVRKSQADFLVSLAAPFINIPAGGTMQVPVNVQRRGYDGPLRLFVENLPPGLHVSGGHVAAAASQQRFDDPNPRFGAARSVLTITAGAELPPQNYEFSIVAVANTPEGPIERHAEGPALITTVRGLRQKTVTAAWLGMKLPAAITRPLPVRLTTGVPLLRISQGNEYDVPYRIERSPNARIDGAVRNTVATQVGNLRVNRGVAGKDPNRGSLLFVTNFATPAEHVDLAFEATAVIDGEQTTIYSPIVTAQVVHGFRVLPENPDLEIAPSSQAEFKGAIHRELTFEGGLIRIEAQDLPDGITCDTVEVPAEEKSFRLRCSAGANAAPGNHEIRLTASAPETGKKTKDTYKIPDTAAHVIVPGASVARQETK